MSLGKKHQCVKCTDELRWVVFLHTCSLSSLSSHTSSVHPKIHIFFAVLPSVFSLSTTTSGISFPDMVFWTETNSPLSLLKSTHFSQGSFSGTQDLNFSGIIVFTLSLCCPSLTPLFSFLKPLVARGTCSFLCQLSCSYCFF